MTPDIEKLISDLRASGTRNLPKNNSGVYMSICDKAADALASLVRERDEAKAIAKRVSKALTSLTPGGSEYHSHSRVLDDYFADTEACVEVVRERFKSGHAAKLEAVELRRALSLKETAP